MKDKVAKVLAGASSVLLATHEEPDGDGLCSVLGLGRALRNAGKDVWLFCPDRVPFNLEFLPGLDKLESSLPEGKIFDVCVVLDCGEKARVSLNMDVCIWKTLVNIDHHASNPLFGDVNWVEGDRSSVGEMVFELISHMKLTVDKSTAVYLYTAVFTDTGSFRYGNTTPLSLRCAADLVEAGADPWVVASGYYESQPAERLRLIGEAVNTLEVWEDCKVAVVSLEYDVLKKYSHIPSVHDGIVNLPRSVRGVEAGVLLRGKEDGTIRASMRSRGVFDVSKVAAAHGGGGHRNAAGCNIRGSMEEVKALLHRDFIRLYRGEL